MNPLAKNILKGFLFLVLLGGVVYGYVQSGLTPERLHDMGQDHPVILITAFFILPFFGAPISLFLLALGITFSLPVSILLLCLGMSFHMCSSYGISAGLFRDFAQFLLDKNAKAKKLFHVSDHNYVITTFLFFFIPGLPYAMKNYLFPLSGVPFKIYVLVGIPTHIALGILFVVLGQQWVEGNKSVLIITMAVIIVISLASHFTRRQILKSKKRKTRSR